VRPTAATGFADVAEALRVLEESVADARATGDGSTLAHRLRQLALAHVVVGGAPAARRLSAEAAALGPQPEDRWAVAWGVHVTGVAAFADGDPAAAGAAFEEELALGRDWESPVVVARALEWLGNVALEEGDVTAAAARYGASLSAYRQAGARSGVSQALLGLGIVALERGDTARPRELLEESLALQRETGQPQGAVLTLEGLAAVAAGTPAGAEHALRLAGAASAARTRPGAWRVWPTSPAARDRLERWVLPARRALAADVAEAAWAAGRATPLEAALAGALSSSRLTTY
jgi:tetratricopeptide (TPR) repeat protein